MEWRNETALIKKSKARVLDKNSLLEFCYLQLTDTSGFGGSKPVPKVRIHPAPPVSLHCRESPPPFPRNTRNMPVIGHTCHQSGLQRMHSLPATDLNIAPFLGTAEWQSGFDDLPRANAMRSQTDDVAKPA